MKEAFFYYLSEGVVVGREAFRRKCPGPADIVTSPRSMPSTISGTFGRGLRRGALSGARGLRMEGWATPLFDVQSGITFIVFRMFPCLAGLYVVDSKVLQVRYNQSYDKAPAPRKLLNIFREEGGRV